MGAAPGRTVRLDSLGLMLAFDAIYEDVPPRPE
jgi:hypothetical protein